MPRSGLAFAAAAALLFGESAGAGAESPIVAAGLSFGQIVAGALPGSVRVSATGSRSTRGATYAGSGFGVSAASFRVPTQFGAMGASGSRAWSVMLPVSATLSSGKDEMTVDGFEYSWSAGGPNSQTLTIGATLHVGARQPSSEYAGTFALTIVYD